MSEVRAQGNESFESLFKRFTKKVQQDAILSEIRKMEHYEKPSVQKKRKAAAKKRKSIRSSKPKMQRT